MGVRHVLSIEYWLRIRVLKSTQLYKKDAYNKSDAVVDNIFCDKNGVDILSEEDHDNLNKVLTVEELLNALNASKIGSAPGFDGLPS